MYPAHNPVMALTSHGRRGTVPEALSEGVGHMGGRTSWFALALGVAAATMSAVPASAQNAIDALRSALELNFWLSGPRYEGVLPACDDPWPLESIATKFAQKEGRFWNSVLTIQGYERIRETAYRPWAPNTIPRRFCSALALVSDGIKHPIHYSIGETTGLIGSSWGVEWCVVGLDRNMAYSPACKMARP
jgi:hypothetical protein